MAKIHTVEWTPAIVPHPIIKTGDERQLVAVWPARTLQEVLEFLDDNELLGGIVGSKADHHGAPYSLTEEFVAVYRMHPLMPDDYAFHSLVTGSLLEKRTLDEIAGLRTPGDRRAPDHARSVLLVRHLPSRRDHAAQLSAPPAEPDAATTASGSIWRRWTSSATASAACRATTSSGGCCTSRR